MVSCQGITLAVDVSCADLLLSVKIESMVLDTGLSIWETFDWDDEDELDNDDMRVAAVP